MSINLSFNLPPLFVLFTIICAYIINGKKQHEINVNLHENIHPNTNPTTPHPIVLTKSPTKLNT